jgi:hypothetical protein
VTVYGAPPLAGNADDLAGCRPDFRSPSMIADPALICEASAAIFRKRLVVSATGAH